MADGHLTIDWLIIKRGVEWYQISHDMLMAYDHWRDILAPYGIPAIVTSARDGVHRTGSRHYTGHAIDLRTRDIPENLRSTLAASLRERLGTGWTVILEKDHLHVQRDA